MANKTFGSPTISPPRASDATATYLEDEDEEMGGGQQVPSSTPGLTGSLYNSGNESFQLGQLPDGAPATFGGISAGSPGVVDGGVGADVGLTGSAGDIGVQATSVMPTDFDYGQIPNRGEGMPGGPVPHGPGFEGGGGPYSGPAPAPGAAPPPGEQPTGENPGGGGSGGGSGGGGEFWPGYVEQAGNLIDRQLAEAREESMKRINEDMASRGLTSSSVAADHTTELEQNLQTQRQDRMLQLQELMHRLEQERELTTRGQDLRERLADQDQRMQALNQILRVLGSVGLGPLKESLEE